MKLDRLRRAARYAVSGRHGLLDRCQEQFAYGHVDWIRRRAGMPPYYFLAARLPHGGWGGWSDPPDGGTVSPFRSHYGRELPVLTWNGRWEKYYNTHGATQALAIGAPWLYMLLLEGDVLGDQMPRALRHLSLASATAVQSRPICDARDYLYVPTHSWEREVVDLSMLGNRLTSHFDPRETSVLLGWGDFLRIDLRRSLTTQGYQVLCAGYRGGAVSPSSPIGDRSIFLANLLSIFLTHNTIVSEMPSTPLVYAASVGKATRIPEDLTTMGLDMLEGIVGDVGRHQSWADEMQEVKDRYNWLDSSHAGVEATQALALETLGLHDVKSPEWLATELRWERIPTRD